VSFSTTTGAVSGTPSTALTLTAFTVTVTDAAGATSSKTFDLTVNAALVTTQALPTKGLTINTASSPFTPVTVASGGTAPYSYALSGGGDTLPTGMSFNTTSGAMSGTPTVARASTTFTVTVTDDAAASSFQTFALTVNTALLTTQAVPTKVGTEGAPILAFTPVTTSGGTTPYAYALSGGGDSLPTGMSFNTTTGAMSGTPTVARATTTFTVTVTDAAGATSGKTFDLTVNSALVTAQDVPSTVGNVGVPMAFTPVTASGGTPIYNYALSGGTLPTGLSFNIASGVVSGTPTATLTPAATFTVTVTDAAGASSFKTFDLRIDL
jgi:nitrite reductase/ring-hydroxylating ferredoxin subunit